MNMHATYLSQALGFLVASVGALCFPSARTVLGAPANYSESVSGDLPLTSPLLLTFENAVNTVSGTFGHDPSDFDAFAFTVPWGSRLVEGELIQLDLIGDIKNGDWWVHAGSAEWLEGTRIAFMTAESPGTATLSAVPLGAGVYVIHLAGFLTVDEPTRAAYAFTFTVVPEPTTVSLLTFGGLVSLRFYRCARRSF